MDEVPILHGEFHPSGMPVRLDGDYKSFDLLILDEFGMAGLGVGQSTVLVSAIPRGHQGLVAAGTLKKPEWDDLQAGVEQDFQIVQQDDVAGDRADQVLEQPLDLPGSLVSGQLEQP